VRWLWPYRWPIGGVLLVASDHRGLDMVWPLAIKRIIDMLAAGERPAKSCGQAAILGARSPRAAGRSSSFSNLPRLPHDGAQCRSHLPPPQAPLPPLIGLPLVELSEMKAGGITSRLSGDVDSVSGLIQMALISPSVALIRVVLTMSIFFWLSWKLAIAALIAMPPIALASMLYMRKVRPIYRSIREDRTEIDARVNETFGGIRIVRAFRREPREELSYATDITRPFRKSLYADRLELVLSTVWGLLIPATVLLIVWYGGYLSLRGHASVSDIVAFQIYAMMLLQPIWSIVNSISQTQRALAAMERVFEILAKATRQAGCKGCHRRGAAGG
jgi:ATP-binding cassette subfamily B protein/subfamily B ATP-binding cassette protein MsbA